MSVRILIADDHQILREGLHALLQKQDGFEIVGEANNGRLAVQLAKQLFPHVVIMDIGMPDLNGIDATQQVLAENPVIKVIALSMHSDRQFVTGMLRAGAKGYLLKDSAFEELTTAVNSVINERIYLSPGITGVVVEDYLSSKETARETDSLTPREREVLQLLSEGQATKEIAMTLHVSVKTIETHRRQLMEKLNTRSVAELTKFAIRAGLTTLEV
ncbi:MAG: DNA-binding response regulator [Planctomycetaceae bacterium]|nr:DNA-binding response regulator [Planctomycetaceae bacterium]